MNISDICVVIGSHISNPKRIQYFVECLVSLVRQTIPIAIHVSISFSNTELKEQTIAALMSNQELVSASRIQLRIQDEKTPQMRHIQILVNELVGVHKWIMFCDDDDTYEPNRALRFAQVISKSLQDVETLNSSTNNRESHCKLIGLYESTFGKDHREHRHEYWCYCVDIDVLIQFYAKLSTYPDVLDDKCCDVLFAEHLRRSLPTKLFARITEKLYNYRIDNNTDSITGVIQSNQPKYTNLVQAPPREQVGEWAEYVVYWNQYLYDNIQVYIHDTYLRTLVGCELDYILRSEFMKNYELIEFVDECHVKKISDYHHRLRGICNELYDISI
jgi:glycosyltransferase involved in cell wall biosynthesis